MDMMDDLTDLAHELRPDGILLLPSESGEFQFLALVSSHWFFRDGDFTPVALVNRRGIQFLETEPGRRANAKREARLRALRGRPREAAIEKRFEREISRYLKEAGIAFEAQKRCRYGIIDLFLPGEPPSIIELKADGLQSSIRQAIGQLAFYSSEFPGARLYIAVPEKLNPDTRKIIERWGIDEWNQESTSFCQV